MRVFCPEHKKGFFAPRQSPIKCGNRGHVLGHLDFQGEAKVPVGLQWQYCCNCEHFCPIDFAGQPLERCPVCTRRSSVLHLCDRCYTVSFESNTPLTTKNFTVTAEGIAKPSCPGCLKPASTDLREHTCEELGMSFTTALNSCPVCQERLDVGPSFPSSVAAFLRKTKAANKVNVTFDYENEVFVAVEDGEFVLIRSTQDSPEQPLLPRAAKFATARDFYEFYQDFYHCPQPKTGEVQVIQPAAVIQTAEGWKLGTSGLLEVAEDRPKPKPVPSVVTPPRVEEMKREPAPPRAEVPSKVESKAAPCGICGTLIESKYAFCWKCGNSLTSVKPHATHDQKSDEFAKGERGQLGVLQTNPMIDDDEATVQHESRPIRSSILSATNEKERRMPRKMNRSVFKLMVAGLVAILIGALGSLGLFVISRSVPEPSSVEAAVTTPVEAKSEQPAAASDVAVTPARQPAVVQKPADDELKALRERRMTAKNTERSAILRTFQKTEKKYPNDYRFPYERAKFAVGEDKKTSRHDAFSALSLAAEVAIASGKAREMLDNLQKDSSGDFRKLSREHEWLQLQEALKSKDARALNVKMGM